MDVKRRVRVTVNGKPYLVEVGDMKSSPITVSVNGRLHVVTIETIESESPLAKPAPALDVVAHRTSAPAGSSIPTVPAGPAVAELKAPMPGNIIDIAVKPGDRVTFGQTLCALEAMKMKSTIRSPRDGAIATVQVREGQAVSHGDVLFTFE
jgi:biotin carboxyl carrier protein